MKVSIGFWHPVIKRHEDGSVEPDHTIAILQCRRQDGFSRAIAIYLTKPSSGREHRVQQRRRCAGDGLRRGLAKLGPEDTGGPVRTTIVSPLNRWFDELLPELFSPQLLVRAGQLPSFSSLD